MELDIFSGLNYVASDRKNQLRPVYYVSVTSIAYEISGACVAAGGAQGVLLGVIVGAAGGVAGCFSGHQARTGLVKALGLPDVYIALLEDLAAIGGCLWVVSRFQIFG